MAKKKAKTLGYLPLVAALLGIVAIVMLFVPAVVASEDVSYNGLKVVFGYTQSEGDLITINLEYLTFSFMNLLSYILVLAGVVCCVLAFMNPKNKLFAFIAFVCFAVAAVFFFLVINFTVPGSVLTFDGNIDPAKVKEDWTLGVGAIVAGVSSALSALAVAGSVVLNK